MAEIYKDFLSLFKVPSRQFKMESKRTIHRHAPAFQWAAAYPIIKMADSNRGSKYYIPTFYQIFLASKA